MIVSDDSRDSPPLRLDQFLKLAGITDTGGQAKLLIQEGHVLVNGDVETRRGRKLTTSDVVETLGDTFAITDYLSAG